MSRASWQASAQAALSREIRCGSGSLGEPAGDELAEAVHRGGEFPGARTWLGGVRGRGRSAERRGGSEGAKPMASRPLAADCGGHHEGHEHGVSRVVMFAQDGPYGLERVVGGVEDRWQAAGFAQPVLCADDAVHVGLVAGGERALGSVAARADAVSCRAGTCGQSAAASPGCGQIAG